MNERIEKLAEQAGFTVARGYGLKDTVPKDVFIANVCVSNEMKRFAELIVEECMNIVSNQTTLDTNEDFREGFNHGLKYAWTDIRKRFGVEE